MMEQVFRSRGFRYDRSTGILRMKIYYEAEKRVLESSNILEDISNELSFFEYSVNEDGAVETVNFHTECVKNFDDELFESTDSIQNRINEVFNDSFKAYTIGYRLKEGDLIGKSIYYYPTIWKKTRYGIKGITDKNEIHAQARRFADFVCAKDNNYDEIIRYVSSLSKFKGCCVTLSESGESNYKLYGRVSKADISNLLDDRVDMNKLERMYGESVLASIRIVDGCVSGYNFYYLT